MLTDYKFYLLAKLGLALAQNLSVSELIVRFQGHNYNRNCLIYEVCNTRVNPTIIQLHPVTNTSQRFIN